MLCIIVTDFCVLLLLILVHCCYCFLCILLTIFCALVISVYNSPLSEWFFSKVGTTTGVGTVRWKKYTIQELLLPKYDKPKAFSAIVDDFTKGKITDKELASRANDLFYKLVGLTGEEVRFIETQ